MRRGRAFEYRAPSSRSPWRLLLPDLSLARFDWFVLLLGMGLLAMGLVFVRACFEADLVAERLDLAGGSPFESHVKKLVVALPAVFIGLYLRPRWLRRHAYLLYAGAIGLLLLVPVIGIELNNARRWIATPIGFDLQPSELAKIAVVLALARSLALTRLDRARDWVRPALLALLPMALVMAQPDLGTSLTIVPVTLGMLHLAGARLRTILGLCAAGLLVAVLAWQAGLVKDYQLRRVDTWVAAFDPEVVVAERNGAAFHTFHARVAIGNGGLHGTGLGEGIANRAGHLPEKESDSIWAVIAEELGLWGSGAVLLAYALFAALILRAAGELRDRFSRLVVGGVGLYFGAHFAIHVGVNTGLLPMTGLTLPLVSTGGSSILASSAALGLALGLSARSYPSLDQEAFRE